MLFILFFFKEFFCVCGIVNSLLLACALATFLCLLQLRRVKYTHRSGSRSLSKLKMSCDTHRHSSTTLFGASVTESFQGKGSTAKKQGTERRFWLTSHRWICIFIESTPSFAYPRKLFKNGVFVRTESTSKESNILQENNLCWCGAKLIYFLTLTARPKRFYSSHTRAVY